MGQVVEMGKTRAPRAGNLLTILVLLAALAVQRLRTATDDFLQVLKLDSAAHSANAKKELAQLYTFLLQSGVQYMNGSYKATGEQKALFQKEALAYLDRAVAIHDGRAEAHQRRVETKNQNVHH